VANLHNAAEPFLRVLRMMERLPIPSSCPLREVIPGEWPTWGEFKRLMEAVSSIEDTAS
jgi:hypothetical protein